MKILHVATYTFPDAFGGAERFIHGLSKAQVASGHEVTVLTGDTGGLATEEFRDGVRVLRYPLTEARGFAFFRHVRARVRTALAALSREGFDILHVHQIASAVPALEAAFPAHRVLSFHASHQLEFEAERLDGAPSQGGAALGWTDRVKSIAIATLDRRCLRKAERIVVHTQFVLGQVEALVPAAVKRVRIIPAGIDVARFAPGEKGVARRRFAIPQEGELIVTVRRLVRRMGIDLLIRAAARLRDRGVAFHVAIGGAGPERTALEALRDELGLSERVTFLGRVPEDDLPELLRAANLIVVPSRSMEGFGMFTVEGLACGTPVLATASGGSPEILGPIDPRLLVQPDPESIADRIESLLHDPELLRRLGAMACESARARFAWERVVSRMDEVYRELVESPARSAPTGTAVRISS